MKAVRFGVVVLAAGVLLCTSCNLFHRSRKPFEPPPPPPPPAYKSSSAKRAPAPLPEPPKVQEAPVDTLSLPQSPEAPPAEIPPPPKPRRTGSSSKTATPAAARAKPPAPADERTPVPKLTQFLTPEQRWQYNQEIDERLLRIRGTLAKLSKQTLSESQMVLLDRVRSFVKQTVETRGTDLVTARSLAHRADLLAQELDNSVR